MMYRRNADTRIRELERRIAGNDKSAVKELVAALFRADFHPYWIRVREITCWRDEIYSDRRDDDPRDLAGRDENLTTAPRRDSTRWEDSEPSLDRKWIFYLHIPMIDDSQLVVYLGQMACFWVENPGIFGVAREGPALLGSVSSIRDWNRWNSLADDALSHFVPCECIGASIGQHDVDDCPGWGVTEISRINHSLATALEGGGPAFYHRAMFNVVLPPAWTPDNLVFPEMAIALNDAQILPFERYAQRYALRDPETVLPERPFLVENYLFGRFYDWLCGLPVPHRVEYATRLQAACCPLNYRLPTQYQGRHIWLYYWKESDSREIIAEPGDYYPDRWVYETGYKVRWRWGINARFYRWGLDPGDDGNGQRINGLFHSIVVNADRPPEEHLSAQKEVERRAEESLRRKLRQMIEVANKWRYEVIVVEGAPTVEDNPYDSTWKAGMQFTAGDRTITY